MSAAFKPQIVCFFYLSNDVNISSAAGVPKSSLAPLDLADAPFAGLLLGVPPVQRPPSGPDPAAIAEAPEVGVMIAYESLSIMQKSMSSSSSSSESGFLSSTFAGGGSLYAFCTGAILAGFLAAAAGAVGLG